MPLSLASAQEVTVQTLSGESINGKLVSIADGQLAITAEAGAKQVAVDALVSIQFKSEKPAATASSLVQATLLDGTSFYASKLTIDGDSTSATSPVFGEVKFSRKQITNLRIAPEVKTLNERWTELTGRENQKDLLVIKKSDTDLDFAPGVVGDIDDANVKFLLGADELPIKRTRVYGLVFYRPDRPKNSPAAKVKLQAGDVLNVSAVSLKDGKFALKLLSGSDIELPATAVQSMDFSQGKIEYLSKLEPRDVAFTPFFDDDTERKLFQFRRDQTMDGLPLKLGGKAYKRGLWIHSRTKLTYRIGTDFSRFEALMGIDENLENVHLGHVHVVISGDGKKLLEADVAGKDKPVSVNLDVSGVRDLEILVDFGRNAGICDHLDLVDARVIK